MRARSERDVVIDAHGKRIRLLEDHAYSAPQVRYCDIPIGILLVKRHQSIDAAPFNKIVHTIERLQERRLAATRGTDERGHLVLWKDERDILERMEIAIMKIQITNFHLDLLIYLISFRRSLTITQRLLEGLFTSKLRTLFRGWSIDR